MRMAEISDVCALRDNEKEKMQAKQKQQCYYLTYHAPDHSTLTNGESSEHRACAGLVQFYYYKAPSYPPSQR